MAMAARDEAMRRLITGRIAQRKQVNFLSILLDFFFHSRDPRAKMKENLLHPVRLAVVMLGVSCCSALVQPNLGVESGAHLQLRPSRLGAASTSILLHRISSRADECAVEVRLGFMYDRITGSVNFSLCV
jgi:hypothetical protein